MASFTVTPRGDLVLCLSPAEARGLRAVADEGAEGLLNDAAAASGYIGGPSQVAAAKRALEALNRGTASCGS